jgi:hypothetical protein
VRVGLARTAFAFAEVTRRRVGFVRRGAIEMGSTDTDLHALRASGAAFFTLPFPTPIGRVRIASTVGRVG